MWDLIYFFWKVECLFKNSMVVDLNAFLFCVDEEDEFSMKYPSVLIKNSVECKYWKPTYLSCDLRKIYISVYYVWVILCSPLKYFVALPEQSRIATTPFQSYSISLNKKYFFWIHLFQALRLTIWYGFYEWCTN